MALNFSCSMGSFKRVTSVSAPFIDFSSVNNFASSVARTSLSPLGKQKHKIIKAKLAVIHESF
jgi:hypothetical protein